MVWSKVCKKFINGCPGAMVVFRCSSGYFSPSYIACNNETSLTPAREKSGARAQADWEAEKKKWKKREKKKGKSCRSVAQTGSCIAKPNPPTYEQICFIKCFRFSTNLSFVGSTNYYCWAAICCGKFRCQYCCFNIAFLPTVSFFLCWLAFLSPSSRFTVALRNIIEVSLIGRDLRG